MNLRPSMLAQFLEHSRFEARVSQSTQYARASHVRRFLDWFVRNGASRLTAPMLGRAYLGHLGHEGLSGTTIRSHLDSLAAFFRYYIGLQAEVEDTGQEIEAAERLRDPFAAVKRPRRDPVRRDPVALADVEHVIEAVSRLPYSILGVRDAAMIAVAIYAGLRTFEIASLDCGQYRRHREGAEIEIIGKGGRKRVVPCPESLIVRLDRYLEAKQRRSGQPKSGDPLFLSTHGRRLRKTAIIPRLRLACRLAGVEERLTLRQLRHSYATALDRAGTGRGLIRDLLGHSSIAVTDAYVDGGDLRELRRAVRVLYRGRIGGIAGERERRDG